MCDKTGLKLCRLCLNSRGLLINVFGENSELEFMLKKTVEDLIDVKVVEDANHPWLVCSTCMEKLTEFRLFKRRCAECLYVFYNRIQKGCNPATKDWIHNRGEFPSEIKKEIDEDAIASDAVDSGAVDVRDDMIVVKEKIDTASGYSVAAEKDVGWPIVASIQECDSHWFSNGEAGNLFRSEIKKEINKDAIAVDTVGGSAVDVRDDMIVVKEEIEVSSRWSATKEMDADFPMVTLMLEGDSYLSSNDKAGILDLLENGELQSSSGEEVNNKEEIPQDIDVLQEKNLERQMLQVQDDGPGQDDTGKESGQRQDGAGYLLHQCHICNKVFKEKDLLKAHIMRVHLKQLICDICSKVFECKSDLHEHVTLIHTVRREYECQKCSIHFQSMNELRIHLLTHSSERPYKCEICCKAFTEKTIFSRHMCTHTDKKKYKCKICSNTFTKNGDLKRHMMIHTGERPYKCAMCAKAFNRKEVLRSHILTHTGEKPFKCEACPRAFAQRCDLRMHKLTHTGEKSFKCNMCSRAFSRKQHLKTHSLTHSVERNHSCAICLKAFKHKSHLIRHKKVHKKRQ